MTDTTALRPALTHAREAGAEYLARRVADKSVTPAAAEGMLSIGFTVTARTLSDLRVKNGMSEQDITDAFRARLESAEADGDPQRAIAAEFALAIWDGMQRDLAEWMGAER